MPTAIEIVTVAFAATNGLRVLAYLPQIVRLARDDSGGAGVSCCTWILFLLSNIATTAYAAMVIEDWQMTAIFSANTICSGAIAMLAIVRRHRLSPCASVITNGSEA